MPAEIYRIKPLEWTQSEDFDTWHAPSVVGGYRVDGAFTALTAQGPRTMLPRWQVYGETAKECTSVEEAKAAAQKDYEARILSAIEFV